MEQPKPNPNSVAIKWTLIGLVTSIILTYIYQFANIEVTSPLKYISYLPFVAFLYLAQKEYKDQSGGYMKFGEGFGIAWRYGVFTGLLSAIFVGLYYGVLSPDMYTKMLDAQREAMAAKGMSSDQVDQGMQFMQKMGLIFVVLGAAIGSAILGMVLGLIGAAILKKERSAFDVEPSDPTV